LENLPELYLERSILVLNQAKKFAWDPTAAIVLELYHRVLVSKASRFTSVIIKARRCGYNEDAKRTLYLHRRPPKDEKLHEKKRD